MAMELTHVRFAYDLKDDLQIKDENAYYCGAIYPDSRYLTGIDRNKTHGDSITRDPFTEGLSDFEKGWSTHLLYDWEASPLYRALTKEPDRFPSDFDDQWILICALKLLEDMESYQQSPEAVRRICNIEYLHPPQEENQEDLKRYSDIQKKTYKQPPGFTEYTWLFRHSINEQATDQVMETARRLQKDTAAMKHIQSIYQNILKETLKR